MCSILMYVANAAYVQPSTNELVTKYVRVIVELLFKLLSRVSANCTLLIHLD